MLSIQGEAVPGPLLFQNPGLIKDAYIYGCDSIMLDLEDAVAENQKDAARFSLYHALATIDYGKTERVLLGEI